MDGQFHVEQRLIYPEAFQECRKMGEGEVLRDPEPYGVTAMPEPAVVQGFVSQRDDAVTVRQEAFPRGREPDGVGVPVQQGLREVLFELAHAGADRRLTQSEPARGTGEAQLGCHGEKAAYESKVEIALHGHRF